MTVQQTAVHTAVGSFPNPELVGTTQVLNLGAPRYNPNRLILSEKATMKLHFMSTYDHELSGMALCEDPNNPLVVTDIMILPQFGSSGWTEFEEDALAEYLGNMEEAGLTRSQMGAIWIHTHPGSSASPSGQDKSQWAALSEYTPWAIMLIWASKQKYNTTSREVTCRFRANVAGDKPGDPPIFSFEYDLELYVSHTHHTLATYDQDVIDGWRDDIASKFTMKWGTAGNRSGGATYGTRTGKGYSRETPTSPTSGGGSTRDGLLSGFQAPKKQKGESHKQHKQRIAAAREAYREKRRQDLLDRQRAAGTAGKEEASGDIPLSVAPNKDTPHHTLALPPGSGIAADVAAVIVPKQPAGATSQAYRTATPTHQGRSPVHSTPTPAATTSTSTPILASSGPQDDPVPVVDDPNSARGHISIPPHEATELDMAGFLGRIYRNSRRVPRVLRCGIRIPQTEAGPMLANPGQARLTVAKHPELRMPLCEDTNTIERIIGTLSYLPHLRLRNAPHFCFFFTQHGSVFAYDTTPTELPWARGKDLSVLWMARPVHWPGIGSCGSWMPYAYLTPAEDVMINGIIMAYEDTHTAFDYPLILPALPSELLNAPPVFRNPDIHEPSFTVVRAGNVYARSLSSEIA